MSLFPFRKAVGLAAVVSLAVAATGCEDKNSLNLDSVFDIAFIELDAGQQIVDIETATDIVVGAPIVIGLDQSIDLASFFFNANDTELPFISSELWELSVIPEDPSITYTQTSSFTGILSGLQVDQTSLSVCIRDINLDVCRVGPFGVLANVED